MTALTSSAPPQISQCNHAFISPGLDQVQCKSCHREWPCWHPDYERLLNQKPTPEQTTLDSASKCSCVPLYRPTPESTPEQFAWVQKYWVKQRNGKKHQYYRFCYLTKIGDISSCVRRHIPGGNTKSAVAQERKQEIERAIAAGWWTTEIEELIKSWKHKRVNLDD